MPAVPREDQAGHDGAAAEVPELGAAAAVPGGVLRRCSSGVR